MGALTGGRWSKRMKRYAGASEFWPRNCLAPSVLRVMWLISNRSKDVPSSCSPSTAEKRCRLNYERKVVLEKQSNLIINFLNDLI